MTLPTAFRLPSVACAIACAFATFAHVPHALAQDGGQDASGAMAAESAGAPGVDDVLATVDGESITAGDIIVAAEDYARQLGASPGEVPIGELLNVLIDIHLVANAAEEAGLDEDDAVKRRIAFERMRTLHNVYLRDTALEAVTDDAVRAKYDEETASFESEDELRLRHILVEGEDEAKQIIADLEAGGDFAKIAEEKSKDPGSAARGGDLDYIARGVTVQPFEDAAFALEVGQITEAPVETQFGWHVIKLEDKRKSSPPEFEAEEPRIRNEMLRGFITDKIAELRESADIEIIEPEAPAADGDAAPAEAPAQ